MAVIAPTGTWQYMVPLAESVNERDREWGCSTAKQDFVQRNPPRSTGVSAEGSSSEARTQSLMLPDVT